jgi:precorrin-4/cobalt-precorrin-4 C11-methyltransferase
VTVHFIGAGPGAADLLTLRGQRLIATSAVCVYAGALIPDEILTHAATGTRMVDTQDLTLDQITEELRQAHEQGHDVARLQSGDLSIYSATAEQTRRLDQLGVPWDLTPGVPAFAAAAAALEQELTAPGIAQTVILTRYQLRSTPMPEGESLTSLATHGATLVLHLAVQAIDDVVEELLSGYPSECPVAVVARAGWPDQLIVRGTLATIAAQVQEAGILRTAVIVVGPVLGDAAFSDSYLYSSSRDRSQPHP